MMRMRMNKMMRVIVKVIMVIKFISALMVIKFISVLIKFISALIGLVSITPGHAKLD